MTEFFRNQEAFDRLTEQLRALIKHRRAGENIRIWCVGCATGEEPYSIALLFAELLQAESFAHTVQIFATDIDERALNFARRGVYPAESVASLPVAMREKYFEPVANGMEIKKVIKQHILFSRHDITIDPPFVKLDLVVCRNLLIYFNNHLQRDVLQLFNYALKENGLLFLGKSESVSVSNELFSKVNQFKIFQKLQSTSLSAARLPRFRMKPDEVASTPRPAARTMSLVDVAKETLYYAGTDPMVIITEHADIKEVQGSLRLYTEMSQGATSTNLLKMANPELVIEIRSLLVQVRKTGKPLTSHVVKFTLFDTDHYVQLKLFPLVYPVSGVQHYMLVFEAINPATNYIQFSEEIIPDQLADYRMRDMEQEIMALREHLQTFTEELETSNEELQSINEELQSANEELKSSNEELETSNEELQSTNEELFSANSELRFANALLIEKEAELKLSKQASERNELLYRTMAENIPNGVIGILDENFAIEYMAGRGMNRYDYSLSDIAGKIILEMNPSQEERDNLKDIFARTLAGESCEGEFGFGDQRFQIYTVPIRYDAESATKVMLLTRDVTLEIQARNEIREREERFRTLADTLPQLIWMSNQAGELLYVSDRWRQYSALDPLDWQSWKSVMDAEVLGSVMNTLTQQDSEDESFQTEVVLNTLSGEHCWHSLRAVPLRDETNGIVNWIGVFTDIDNQKKQAEHLEKLVSRRTAELQRSNDDLQQFAHVASHDLKEPIRKIRTFSTRIQEKFGEALPTDVNVFLDKINSAAQRMYSMIDGVLLYSSLDSGEQNVSEVDLAEIIAEIRSDLEVVVSQKKAKILVAELPVIEGVRVQLYQLFYNLINNSLKFSGRKRDCIIEVTSEPEPDEISSESGILRIDVKDNGIGFDAADSDSIFKTFYRLHNKSQYEGNGLGLSLCKKIAERHGGAIEARQNKPVGAVFSVRLPIRQPEKKL